MGRADSRPRERQSRLSSGSRRPDGATSSPSSPGFLLRLGRTAAACLLGLPALPRASGAWAAALLVLAALALPAPATAQTGAKLVSNTGQADTSATAVADEDNAQPFTTGSNADGYKLTAVNLSVLSSTVTPSYTAQIFRAASNGQPTGNSLGTLTNPSSLTTDGIKTWTASGSGIDLDAGTGYVFVLDSSADIPTPPFFDLTASDDEDRGGASGWSIDNSRFRRSFNSSSWLVASESLKIEIHGHAKLVAPSAPRVLAVPGLGDRLSVSWSALAASSAVTDYDLRWYKGAADPEDEADWIEAGEAGGHDVVGTATKATLTGLDATTAYRVQVRAVNAGGAGPWSGSGGATTASRSDTSAPTGGALVSNTGQTVSTSGSIDLGGTNPDLAQAFDTGSNADGYKLTAVKAAIPGGSGSVSYSVKVFLADNNTGQPTGDSLGTLTNPSSLATSGTKTWTATGGGIDLDPNEGYVIVWDVTTSASSNRPGISTTNSDNEDSNRAAGWSIANDGFQGILDTAWQNLNPRRAFQIELHGYAKRAPEAPVVRAVSGLGDRLTVRWRERVNAGGAVTDYDIRYFKGAADPAKEADWIEPGEAGGHDHVGTARKATLTGLDALTTYRVQVRAVTASGNGPWSASGVATTAAWQTSGSLVSNTGQTRVAASDLNADHSQPFATGSSAEGYKLTRVDLQFEVGNPSGSTGASYSVEIWSTNHGASFKPVTRVGTLTNPSSLSAGLNTFTASGAGIDLNADAHYTVVVDASSAGNRQESLVATSSNAEDAGSAADWDISDGGDVRTGSTWIVSSWNWKVAIHGYTKTVSTSGASPGALVGNTGQAAASTTLTLRGDNAQPFTTGGNGNGYKLTAVKMSVTGGSVEPTYTAKIFRAASNGQPTGSSLGTLTNPSSLATSGTKTWTASGGGIDLDANTGYVLVLDASALGGPGFDLTHTESDAEDAGASAGWSIDNSSFGRSFASSTWILRASSVQIAIHGYAKEPPPALAAPSVSAVPLQPDRLSVGWPPPAGAPATDYDLRWHRGSVDPEDEADWIEAGEPGGHDHAGVLRTATLTGLLPSTTYRVQVRAVNDNGAGPWSASGSGRTAGEASAWGSAAVEVLIGNFREVATAVYPLAPHDRAQGFTTDGPPLGHPLGYTVTSVDLEFATAPDPGVRVRLATGASTSAAGTTLATLRNPATFGGGANRFTAPAGTTLDPNTEYFVVVEGSAGELTWTRSSRTEGRVHWKMSDTSLFRGAASTGAWTASNERMSIRVNGRENVGDPPGAPDAPTAVPQPGTTGVVVTWFAPDHTGSGITDYDLRYFEGRANPADELDWIEEDESTGLADRFKTDTSTAATITGLKVSTTYRVQVRAVSHGAPGPWSASASVTTGTPTAAPPVRALVSNTGQADTSATAVADEDNAQPFTTGSNADGYKLTAVNLSVLSSTVTPSYTAQIFRAASNGQPTGNSLGTLTNPSSLTTDGIKTWTASGSGIDLDAGTGYVFVLDSSADIPTPPFFDLTASDDEDRGGASGWSIDNSRFRRSFNSSSWLVASESLKIEIHGHAKRNSAPTRAKLAGTPADGCVADPQNVSWGTLPVHAGALYSVSPVTDTSQCFPGTGPSRKAPMFLDPDGDELAITAIATIPDNVRFIDGTPIMDGARDRFFIRAVAAGAPTDVRVDVTATDPHGESVSTFFFAQVHPFPNAWGAPRFDEMVGVRGFPRNRPIERWVLPPANGGDMTSRNWAGQLPYFYAVSGLPPGLSFDPLTRAVTGTPTTNGAYTVTYTADDADVAFSLKGSPSAADLADVARQSFVVQVGAPAIELVQLRSAPTHDSDGDGSFDTYVEGDTLLFDVQFTEAVEVTGTPETPGARPRLRLDLGPSSGSEEENRVFAELLEDGELPGDQKLRFGYTVRWDTGCPAPATDRVCDTDPDGVWLQTGGGGTVVFVPAGLGIASVESGAPAVLTYSGLPTSGLPNAMVDGSVTGASVGPRPVSAETDADGDTVTVTFNRNLSPQIDLSGFALSAYFSVRGAGHVGAGQQGAYQHPDSVRVDGDRLVLELGTAARASDTVTLTYENVGTGVWPLKDVSTPPKRLAGFTDLAVTNSSTGVAAPVPLSASAVGTALELVFDQRLDQDARPPGTAFTVHARRLDGVERTYAIAGTAAEVAIDDAKVDVTLSAPVLLGDVLDVSYDPPAASPLAAAAGSPAVESFLRFHVRGVHDSTPPTVVPHDAALDIGGTKHRIDGVVQTTHAPGHAFFTNGRSLVFLYFDEPLDGTSVPDKAAFTLSGDEGAHARTMANVTTIGVTNNALTMVTNVRFRLNRNYTIAYTPPAENPLQDLAGNAVAKATWTVRAFSSGKPVVRGATVNGDVVRIAMQQVLSPSSVPPPSAFKFWEADTVTVDGVTTRPRISGTATAVWMESTFLALRLTYPVLPCQGLHPFRVSYDKPADVNQRLRTADRQEADSWGPEKGGGANYALATNALASQCVRVR